MESDISRKKSIATQVNAATRRTQNTHPPLQAMNSEDADAEAGGGTVVVSVCAVAFRRGQQTELKAINI